MFTPRISSPSSSELRPTKTTATSEPFASASASESVASAGGIQASWIVPPAPVWRYSTRRAYFRPASRATRTRTGRRGPGAAWVEVTWVEGPPPTVSSLSSRNRRAVAVQFHMPVRTVTSYSPLAGGVSVAVQRIEYFS